MKQNRTWLPYGVILCLQAALLGVAGAQTLYLSPSVIAPLGAQNIQSFTFPTPSIELKDYDAIQVTVDAPACYAWLVNIVNPDGRHNNPPALEYDLEYANSLSYPWATISSASLDFDFVQGGQGNLSAPSSFGLIPTAANGFELDQGDTVNGDFAFTGFTMTVNFDNSSLIGAPLEGFFSSELRLSYGGDFVGSSLTLVGVPEPTSGALGTLGVLVLLFFRRKQLLQAGAPGINSTHCHEVYDCLGRNPNHQNTFEEPWPEKTDVF
jgi:hypothetical protein